MTEIGCCSDHCACCPRYIATVADDVRKLKEAARMWKRVGWRDTVLGTEAIRCGGCSTVTWCRYHEIRDCARGQRLANCGECDRYPCAMLEAVFDRTDRYAEKCRRIFDPEDFATLSRAFFFKRRTLDAVASERRRRAATEDDLGEKAE